MEYFRQSAVVGAVGRYGFDMAGKGNSATRDWAASLVLALRADVDQCVAGLRATPVPVEDVGEMSKRVRFIADIARAAKLIVALAPDDEDEAEMSDDDRGAEPDDPEELDRLHRELQSRVAEIHSVLEAKRREGWTFNRRVEADPGGASEAGEASGGAAGGLVHLAADGRAGIVQDLRGRALAGE
jgi:hypothetical protein